MKKLTAILKRTAKLIPLWAIITGLLFFSSLWGAVELLAQTPVPGGGGSEGAPIDAFAALLVATGAGYGIKKLRNTNPKDRKTKS